MNVRLDAEPRTNFGKGAARQLRRAGRIPVVLYGGGSDVLHLSLEGHDLEQALRKPKVTLEIITGSTTILTKPRDIQRDPLRRTVEHVDLIIVSAGEASERAAEAEVLVAAAVEAAEAAASAPAPRGVYEQETPAEGAAVDAESADADAS